MLDMRYEFRGAPAHIHKGHKSKAPYSHVRDHVYHQLESSS